MNIAVSQALASGLPVIATRHSGLPEQVHDGVHGLLVNEGDYRNLAKQMLFLVERPELWSRYGRAGREHVLRHYNEDDSIELQISLYEKIIREN